MGMEESCTSQKQHEHNGFCHAKLPLINVNDVPNYKYDPHHPTNLVNQSIEKLYKIVDELFRERKGLLDQIDILSRPLKCEQCPGVDETLEKWVSDLSKLNPDMVEDYLSEHPVVFSSVLRSMKTKAQIQEMLTLVPQQTMLEFCTSALSQLSRLSSVFELSRELKPTLGSLDFINEIEQISSQVLHKSKCVLLMPSHESSCLVSQPTKYQIPINRGLISRCFRNMESLVLQDPITNEFFEADADGELLEDGVSALVLPFISSNSQEVYAVMVATAPTIRNKFTKEDLLIAQQISLQVSPYISMHIDPLTADVNSIITKARSLPNDVIKSFASHQFNIYSINGNDRIIMLISMFMNLNIEDELSVSMVKLTRFLLAIRGNYKPTTPYHNWTHACDVGQFVYATIISGHLERYLSKVELFSLLLASICHDVGHLGLNNNFHKKARTALGILYQGKPIMEMHHASTSLLLMEQTEMDFVSDLPKASDRTCFYNFFLNIILATDMELHFKFLTDFNSISSEFDSTNELHRLLLAQIVMKTGDVSNTVRPFQVSTQMATQLSVEFFKQGDLEKSKGMDISNGCNRETALSMADSQIGFYENLAGPLIRSLVDFLKCINGVIVQFESNLNVWKAQKASNTN